MKKFLLLTLMLFALKLGAQVPSQFQKLLTTSTDYTCVGVVPCASWPMPAMPAAGASYFDPTWKTLQYRLAVGGFNLSGQVIPCYSRVQQFNYDNTRMMMVDLHGDAIDIYDATTTPPTPINVITTTFGNTVYPDCVDNDAYWGNTLADKNIIYFQASSGSVHGLDLMKVDVSACTSLNCQLTPSVIKSFSCTSDALSNPELTVGTAGNKIETGSGGQGGWFDKNDRFFAMTCDKVDGAGRHNIDFILYDTVTNVTTQFKWYALCPGGQPAGCSAYWYASQTGKNLIRMWQHPDGYITVAWQSGATNGVSGTSSPPTHINLTSNVLTVTASNTFKVGTEAKFHNLSAMSYLNNYFGVITSASSTQFTLAYTPGHADDDQNITSGTITGLSCSLDVNWVRGCGLEAFDHAFTYLGGVMAYIGHHDGGYDVNGYPVIVGVTTHQNNTRDADALGITRLDTGLSTTQINQHRVLLPCNYSRTGGCGLGVYLGAKAGSSHISMVSSSNLPGYGLFSTMINAGPQIAPPVPPDYPTPTTLGTAVAPGTVVVTPGSMAQIGVGVVSTVDTGTNMESVTWTAVTATQASATFTKSHAATASVFCFSCGDTGFAAMENIAVKIDYNAAPDAAVAFWRIGRNMAIRDNTYDAEPHTTINRNFTQIVWGSTWNKDPVDFTSVNGYWQALPIPTAAIVTSNLWAMDINTTSTAAPNIPAAPTPSRPFGVMRIHDDGANLADIFGMTATGTCNTSTHIYTGCNWTAFDHWVSLAQTGSYTLMYAFHKTPNFAGTYTSSPPDDADDIAMIDAIRNRGGCTAIVQTGCIKYWEIWNEPNNDPGTLSSTSSGTPYWSGSIENLIHHAGLIVQEVKTVSNGGVNGVDPNAVIVAPGAAGFGDYTNLAGGMNVSGGCTHWGNGNQFPEAFICEYLRRTGSGVGDLTGAAYTDVVSQHSYPNGGGAGGSLSTISEAGLVSHLGGTQTALGDNGLTLCAHGTQGTAGGPCRSLFSTEDGWGQVTVASVGYPRIGPDATNSSQISGSGLTGSFRNDQAAFLFKRFQIMWTEGVDLSVWYGWDFQNGWGMLLCTGANTPIGCDLASSGQGSYPYQNPAATAYGAMQQWMIGKTMSTPCSEDGNQTWTCFWTGPYYYKAQAIWNSNQSGVLTSISGYPRQRDYLGTITSFPGTITPNWYPVVLERPATVNKLPGGWN